MQTMFGGGVPQVDMFAKLEQMREVITEVNSQFKDPVGAPHFILTVTKLTDRAGQDDLCLRLHIRIPFALRDRTAHPRTHSIRDRHT